MVRSTYNYAIEYRKDISKLFPIASWPDAIINPEWLELPKSRTDYHSPKDVRAIEVRLYNISAAIIKGSTRIVTSDAYSVFMKTGGAQQAVKDFKLLKPKIVENHKVNIISYAISGIT